MTASIGQILSVARTALNANQTAISVISHNIANAQTEGYSRQRVELTENNPLMTPQGGLGTGVLIRDIARVRDLLLDPAYRNENAGSGYWQQRSDLLGQVEALHGDITTGGLQSSFEAFWNAWSDLANDPSNSTARTVVRQTGAQLVNEFKSVAAGLDRFRQDADRRLGQDVRDMNALSVDIARLNDRIVAAEAGGISAADLRDQRDLAIDKLSRLSNVQVVEHQNGSIGVHIGGINLVDGPDAIALAIDTTGGTYRLVSQRGPAVTQAGGEVGATIEFLNVDAPAARAELDALAQALVDSVNTVHRTGMNAAGATNVSFFEDFGNPATVTAATIQLSADIANAQSIAAGTGILDPLSGNVIYASGRNDVALGLAGLRTSPVASLGGRSLADAYADSVSRVGSDLRTALDNAEVRTALAFQADIRRSSVNGVSIDEEMVQLIRFQNAYAAAARVITAADEMLETILNI